MDYQEELDKKIKERLELIQANIKNNTFSFDTDGSFKIKLELLNEQIGQLQDKILEEIHSD